MLPLRYPTLPPCQLDFALLHLADGVRRMLLRIPAVFAVPSSIPLCFISLMACAICFRREKYVPAGEPAYIFSRRKRTAYRMHRLSLITQRLLFVKVLALVRPSPVLLAIVNVQKPSPPNPSAA